MPTIKLSRPVAIEKSAGAIGAKQVEASSAATNGGSITADKYANAFAGGHTT
jgi:hypothetical protein